VRHLVVGTAGHIDHGKSAIVEALTGVHPDRLVEEQRRGITIELGFADLELPPEGVVGFVDVPGHERFVRHMVAGATGFDAAMLVIAADEGVKPQTREHLAIMSLLGLAHGFVVLSKSDLVEHDLLELVAMEAREFLAGSFLAGAPVIPASAKTGAGIEELREALRGLLTSVPARAPTGVPRLAVDRSFAMRGFGTVVTGTLATGTLRVGDEVELLPSGARGRIRGLQVHKRSVPAASAGGRLAVNLQGLAVAQAPRGATLTSPGALRPTRRARVRVRWLPSALESVRRGGLVRMHHGTSEDEARLRVPRGSEELAEVHFAAPVVLLPGDRFVLRRPHPFDTIGGGVVIDAHPPRKRAGDTLRATVPAEGELVHTRIVRAGAAGAAADDLAAEIGWSQEEIEAEAGRLAAAGAIVRSGGRLVDAEAWSTASQAVAAELARAHRDDPLRSGVTRESLRRAAASSMGVDLFRALLDDLATRGAIRIAGDRVAAATHEVALGPEDRSRCEAIEEAFRRAGLDPPDAATTARALAGPRGPRFLELLVDRGRLVRIVDGRLFHAEALEEVRRKVRAWGSTSSTMDVATFKDLAGVTRKNAIPLLEQLDAERVTRRVGNVREIVARDLTR
jgi:selenocysteine-specific elongation factor